METTESLKESKNVEETINSNSSEKLIEREQIGETPFTLVTEEKGSFVALGQHRITEYGTKHEMEEKVMNSNTDWPFLVSVIATVVKVIENENK